MWENPTKPTRCCIFPYPKTFLFFRRLFMDDDSFFLHNNTAITTRFSNVKQSKCLIFSGHSIIFSIHLVTFNRCQSGTKIGIENLDWIFCKKIYALTYFFNQVSSHHQDQFLHLPKLYNPNVHDLKIKEVLSSIKLLVYWLVSKCNSGLFVKWYGRFLTRFGKQNFNVFVWSVTIMIMSWKSSNHSRPNSLGFESQQTPYFTIMDILELQKEASIVRTVSSE